ncbi:MAG: ABC transporter ATP-binding protein [Acidimicrobiaceae bacterium]|nr:ABC transporter ATP-binding protein [Acidimicrobiaceae bacterium]MCY4175184.1 ABC transporter ATP-binding protein [Acidimicrobiaceae bacterium]MCY4279447.1 ABC transporter ATP-binding protein [Acidimicrobiaceae bacterium]MCY4293815.1 ABC transporter ATP-binding protein [Acidimicrobiaceae bacterium]
MNSSVTVRVRDAHVYYRVYEDPLPGLKKIFAQRQIRRRYRTVRAVRGVNLDLHESETLGLIGANGAGKTTLLSAMTGLLPLESGSILGRSRPSLLGVSSALRPALSGRRNILIGGLALGFSHAEIESRIDEIIDFSGLRDAIDRPMRTYSSGMRARLHFSIATARIPEILLIDEALAVGDEEFRHRSAQRIDEITAAAGSVVLGTHVMSEIERHCDRVAWLEGGVLKALGDPGEVVAAYLAAVPRSGSG